MPTGNWDFEISRIPLDTIAIDASEKLGMVIVQPKFELEPDGSVPFEIRSEYREAQADLIQRAFEIRAAESTDRGIPIPFLLLPEFSIPTRDPDGLSRVKELAEKAEGDVIFVGGLEGVSPSQVDAIVNKYAPAEVEAEPAFTSGLFVNILVIAVKPAGGPLAWHFQSKLVPSQWEGDRNMALGSRILFFDAPRVKFLCQICFDHLASQGQSLLTPFLCKMLGEKAAPHGAILDYVFVPQANPKPEHPIQIDNTKLLLNYEDRYFKGDRSAVVVINMAASDQESREFGRSGFHYKSNRWSISEIDVGPRTYELHDHDDTTSAVFRKRTPSIHVTTVIHPTQNTGLGGDRPRPLDNPRSYLIEDGCDATPCSCPKQTLMSAGEYVECECLPCKLRDTLLAALPGSDVKNRWGGSDSLQSDALSHGYEMTRRELLKMMPNRSHNIAKILLNSHNNKCDNPDTWTDSEREAYVEMASAISVLAEYRPCSFDVESLWTLILNQSLNVVVIDGANKLCTYGQVTEEYLRQFETQYFHPDRRRKPVLVAALRSGGALDEYVEQYRSDFTSPRVTAIDDFRNPIDKPRELRVYVCQDRLFEGARQAPAVREFMQEKMECTLD